MNQSLNPKYYALRVKTDRELASLIGKRLERGLASAQDLAYGDAGKAYEDARAWMPLVERLERRRLERRLEELREMLDESTAGTARVRRACG